MEGGDKMLQFMIHLMHQYGPIRVEHFIDVKGNIILVAVHTLVVIIVHRYISIGIIRLI